ncbi:MAG: hypothetical protein CVU57_01365 [Deltaproteobacteria bacterium HGW-Deltaproteobacteria-15]|jgi:hypothetical protein|nr:MAG: hypothetical protein CVU57_01365 [Deltaproteobacteria bacterium HGW-Deltaproteobacteria-15]
MEVNRNRIFLWKGTWFIIVLFLASITTVYGVVKGVGTGGIGISSAEGKIAAEVQNSELNVQKGIVGKWIEPNIEYEIFRFLDNGVMVTNSGKRYAYQVVGNKIFLTGKTGEQRIWEVNINGNTMTIDFVSAPDRFKEGKLSRSEFGIRYLKKS